MCSVRNKRKSIASALDQRPGGRPLSGWPRTRKVVAPMARSMGATHAPSSHAPPMRKSKHTAVLASDAESEMDDSSEGENSPCKYCKGLDCDCSVMSDNSYGSTAAGSPVEETLA